ncbi:MAG: hydrogenase maturation protease [Micromonosporaceae bacterium]
MSKTAPASGRVVVIGVGNPFRRDDGVGPAVVQRLRRRHLPGVTLAESDGEPSQLLDLWAGVDLAIVVDAVRLAQPAPGRIHRRSLRHPSTPRVTFTNSHSIDLGEAVALAAALDRLPPALRLYAVEAADISVGVGLSPAVQVAATELVEELVQELRGRDFGPGSIRATGSAAGGGARV